MRSLPPRTASTSTTTATGKGLENLRKGLWPDSATSTSQRRSDATRIDQAKKLVFLDIDIDEGKPFTVSRIEFTGNTVTRDRVIRRELFLEEGSVYNSIQWENSILRLNQLDYFNPLTVETGFDHHPGPRRTALFPCC